MADQLLRRDSSEPPWTPEQLAEFAALLTDVNAAIALLSPEERAEYERCQQSVIDARRYAERHAHEIWIG
jgi:ADP-heptose:LPS heptosyltransferase